VLFRSLPSSLFLFFYKRFEGYQEESERSFSVLINNSSTVYIAKGGVWVRVSNSFLRTSSSSVTVPTILSFPFLSFPFLSFPFLSFPFLYPLFLFFPFFFSSFFFLLPLLLLFPSFSREPIDNHKRPRFQSKQLGSRKGDSSL